MNNHRFGLALLGILLALFVAAVGTLSVSMQVTEEKTTALAEETESEEAESTPVHQAAEVVYRPEDRHILEMQTAQPEEAAPQTVQVPILMYHHIDDTYPGSETVTPEQFALHMQVLENAGYHTVSFRQLIAFVDEGEPLPEKPLVITFDDGYRSNLEIAVPILQQHGFCAEIAVVGESIGGGVNIPHFSLQEVKPLVENGTLEIGAHTWALHDPSPRKGISLLENESVGSYVTLLDTDTRSITRALKTVLGEASVYAYPYGIRNEVAEALVHSYGYRVTLTVEARTNTIREGDPTSLYELGRWNVPDTMDSAALLAMLD